MTKNFSTPQKQPPANVAYLRPEGGFFGANTVFSGPITMFLKKFIKKKRASAFMMRYDVILVVRV